jgi:hypothetical protein
MSKLDRSKKFQTLSIAFMHQGYSTVKSFNPKISVEQHEGVETNLLVCSVRAGVAEGAADGEQELRRGAGGGRRWSGEGGWRGEVVEY